MFCYWLLKKILQRCQSWEHMGQIKVFPTYNIYYIDNIYNRKKNSSNMTILGIYCWQKENYTTSFPIYFCFVFSCIFFCFVSILLFCFIFILHFLFDIYLTIFYFVLLCTTLIIIGIIDKLSVALWEACFCVCTVQ